MEIQVEELDYCKLNVHYEASLEEIQNKKNDILNLFKDAPVPGWNRAKKANIEVIKLHYKSQIDESLKRALAEDAFHNTLFEKDLRPLGSPDFTNLLLQRDKFVCDFKMNVKPKFELGQYKGLEIPKPESKDVNEVAEEMLQQLRIKFGESVPFGDDDFVMENDNIIVNYTGFIDGEKISYLSTEGELVTVGQSELKEFDQNLLGMMIGDTRSFDVTIPENTLPSVSGKVVKFEVTLINGSKILPCGLDDSLANKFNKNSFEELHKGVVDAATARVDQINKAKLSAQISHKLIGAHDFKVPEWLALAEAKYLAHQSQVQWDVLLPQDQQKYIDMANNNVKLSLLLDKIREDEPEAQLSDQETIDMVKELLAKTNPNASAEDVIKQMSTNGNLQALFIRLRDEFVLDFIIKNATIIE